MKSRFEIVWFPVWHHAAGLFEKRVTGMEPRIMEVKQ